MNARLAGPRLGADVQKVIRAAKDGEWTRTPSGGVVVAGIELREDEYERRLVARDPGAAALPSGSGLVVLDTEVTPELAAEGVARDVVRLVQQARRDAGLDVSDRITLVLEAPGEVEAAVRAHEAFVAGEVLALEVVYGPVAGDASGALGDGVSGTVGDGAEVRVSVTRRPKAD